MGLPGYEGCHVRCTTWSCYPNQMDAYDSCRYRNEHIRACAVRPRIRKDTAVDSLMAKNYEFSLIQSWDSRCIFLHHLVHTKLLASILLEVLRRTSSIAGCAQLIDPLASAETPTLFKWRTTSTSLNLDSHNQPHAGCQRLLLQGITLRSFGRG